MQEISTDELIKQIRCVSHEIKNYISICDMYTQIINKSCEKNGTLTESVSNATYCIHKSLNLITSSLLDLKSMNVNLELNWFPCEELISRCCEFAKAYIDDKQIEIKTFFKYNPEIFVDENKFCACLINIIKNAIESISQKGTIDIVLYVKGNSAVINIINDGNPISKNKQNKIFETGYTTKKTGCGLGLDICKNFFNQQKGDLILKKSTSKETVFEITLNNIR